VLRLSRKIISASLKIGGSKMQPFSGNQRPDLLTALMNMSLVPRLPRKMHLCRSSSNVPYMIAFFPRKIDTFFHYFHIFTFFRQKRAKKRNKREKQRKTEKKNDLKKHFLN